MHIDVHVNISSLYKNRLTAFKNIYICFTVPLVVLSTHCTCC